MNDEINRRTFLVAGGLTTAATMISLSAAGRAAAAPAKGSDFAPRLDYVFRDDTVDADTRLDDIMRRLTLEEKVAIAASGASAAVPRLGLNAGRSAGGEGLHGVQGGKATVFPSPLGTSQSWDQDLFHEIGDIIAKESIADNGGIGRLAPVMDLLHDPRAGRDYETMGEDAYLNGALGTAMTGGMNQRTEDGYQQFLPILKHFMAYNNEINRLWTNSVIPPRVAREYYTKTFMYPVSAGYAKSVMTSYPLINGKPMSVNPFLNELLNEWTPDYKGTGHSEFRTINDYGSGSSMWVHSQRYFADDPDGRALGSAEGLKNGQMSWSFRNYGDPVAQIYDALIRGMLSEQDVERNARRNLALSLRLGDFDHLRIRNPYTAETAVARASLLPGHRNSALRAAQEQIVLLKNDDRTLPLRGASTNAAVLIGSLGEEVLKDFYTGNWIYAITIKNALENKLGATNVHYTRAVDTVAIKASNGKYLVSPNNATFREPGAADPSDTPILATGTAATDNAVQRSDVGLLFEFYDYGGLDQLLRTPINDRFVQVPHVLTSPAYQGTLINNTSAPGEGSYASGSPQYVNYQKFRVVPTDDGKYGLYNPVAGDGGNNSYGESAMAYDQDDEDVNNGSYLRLITSGGQANQIVADTSSGHVGPYRAETHAVGPDIAASPFDRSAADNVVDSLLDEYKFDVQSVQTSTEAIDAALAGAPADAPVLLVVGYEPHLNAREAVDLEKTGLGEQQIRNIDYITKTKGRDVILLVKTGSPMTIDESVHNNPKIKAIVEIGHSGQEEGSALVSALFDDGYTVPATGWAPAADSYSPYAPYGAYPGYLDAGNSIAAYAPAGRLTATWYRSVSDMVGASGDHPPASYRWPAYAEAANDNLSNLNGTVPTGLLTYDIIKGERTYQYFNGSPLYAFGYGLTYTEFVYSDVSVSPIVNGKFTVSGRVTNTGTRESDEVVQIYSRFAGAPSRIKQANSRLIAFDRLRGVAPREARAFRFEVDLKDKLGVWDVETGSYIVEPGTYSIRAAKSSSDPGTAVVLKVAAGNGGTPAVRRNLNRQVLAENFDDYSDLGARVADVELVSAGTELNSNTAVQFREDGAWVTFKNVSIPAGTSWLTIQVGADRAGAIEVYTLPVGASPAFTSAAPVAEFSLVDTRPISGLPTGLGIGPIAVTGQPYSNRPYPGSPVGQNGLDANGQPYKNAYVKPAWRKLAEKVSVRPGTYDVYIVAAKRGARIEWLKFGPSLDQTHKIEISQPESLDSIREKGGQLRLGADLTPVTSVSPVTWSVSAVGGSATDLATITADSGVLHATGKGNGTVLVKATSAGNSATNAVLITNQLDANMVVIGGRPMTVDYIILRTGAAFGPNDNIQRFRGTNQQTAVFSGLFSENPNGYYLSGSYLTIPAGELDWKVTDPDGAATGLATIDGTGLVTATGIGDGDVVVTATLKNNPAVSASRRLALRNQGVKDAFTMIQAENFDATSSNANAGSTWGLGGNEFGMQIPMPAGSTWTFKNVDFGRSAPDQVAIRLAPASGTTPNVAVDVWADAATASAGGTLLGTVSAETSGSNVTYATFVAAITGKISGVHDIFLAPSTPVRLNWFAFG